MAAQLLWILGSAVILLLSSAHLYFTFFSDKFSIHNPVVEEGMKHTSPKLTPALNLWNAWIGFNATHSSGGMFIGIINIYLAAMQWDFLVTSLFIQLLTLVTTLFMFLLGRKYWFSTPTNGVTISFMCYMLAFTLMHLPVDAFK